MRVTRPGLAVAAALLLLSKLDLRDRTQTVVFAYENGLIQPRRA
jgi:hypothetical protein